MTIDEFVTDMTARAFSAYAESNPRLKELAEKDSNKTATPEEEKEFFRLLNKADTEFFGDDPFMDIGLLDDNSIW